MGATIIVGVRLLIIPAATRGFEPEKWTMGFDEPPRRGGEDAGA